MIPLVIVLGFFGLFGSKADKDIESENHCYYIENFFFREKDFLLIDRNDDSLLSYSEAKIYRIPLFLDTDTDKNGQIHFREFYHSMWNFSHSPSCNDKKIIKAYEKKIIAEYQKMDIDKNSTVIPSEYETYGSYSFDIIDSNDDNYIEFKELDIFHQNLNSNQNSSSD